MAAPYINPSMFRGYDIRGIVGTDLTPEVLSHLGNAYATFLHRRQIRECVVGRDIRESSNEFQNRFIESLISKGIDVIDIGLTLTQIMYFSQYKFLSKGGAMVTASHNPKEFNGLKLAVGFSDTLITKEIEELKIIAQTGEFKDWGSPGIRKTEDVFHAYKTDLFKREQIHESGLKVVIDCSSSTPGKFLPEILRTAGCTVIEQNTNLDSSFPHGTTDPTSQKVVERLAERVRAEKADLGVTYDSDGDRLGMIDGKGRILWNDVLVAIFASDILDYLPGSPIVFNALCSKVVTDVIKSRNGKPVMSTVGHSFVKQKVREERAPFGGELSGHFFFYDNFYGHDDAAFSTLRILQYLKRTNQSLSDVIDKLPRYISSPEIKLGLPDEIKFEFITKYFKKDLEDLLPNGTYTDIDGFRADTETAMAIIRASQNGPYITVRFEGKTEEEYESIRARLNEILKKYPEIDWDTGENSKALTDKALL